MIKYTVEIEYEYNVNLKDIVTVQACNVSQLVHRVESNYIGEDGKGALEGMTREEFKKLCYEYQDGEFSDGFDAYGLVNALGAYDIEFDDLNSHESVKEWFKYCIEEEYNIGPLITKWYYRSGNRRRLL